MPTALSLVSDFGTAVTLVLLSSNLGVSERLTTLGYVVKRLRRRRMLRTLMFNCNTERLSENKRQ